MDYMTAEDLYLWAKERNLEKLPILTYDNCGELCHYISSDLIDVSETDDLVIQKGNQMTFEEFLDLDVSYKFVTLDDFYRDHLYLWTLSECFYGDARSKYDHYIFTKYGHFDISYAPSDELFKLSCSTVLFKKDLEIIFFDSEEAVEFYKQKIDLSNSSHYTLSKDEIIDIIDDDLRSQIEHNAQIIGDYRSKIKMHQSVIDELSEKRFKLRAMKGD